MLKKEIPVITVDGPSGSGKGTICVQLAKHFGYQLLDSGALYRLTALEASNQGIDEAAVEALVEIARSLDVQFVVNDQDEVDVILAGNKVNIEIRTETCGNNASKIAAIGQVRTALLDRQRNFLTKPGLIADGRDMGTVVFPQATTKIYLTASAEERAKRRYKQLKGKGLNVNLAHLSAEIKVRDERDMNRTVAPLLPAEDAYLIDTTGLSIDQVVENILVTIEQN